MSAPDTDAHVQLGFERRAGGSKPGVDQREKAREDQAQVHDGMCAWTREGVIPAARIYVAGAH